MPLTWLDMAIVESCLEQQEWEYVSWNLCCYSLNHTHKVLMYICS